MVLQLTDSLAAVSLNSSCSFFPPRHPTPHRRRTRWHIDFSTFSVSLLVPQWLSWPWSSHLDPQGRERSRHRRSAQIFVAAQQQGCPGSTTRCKYQLFDSGCLASALAVGSHSPSPCLENHCPASVLTCLMDKIDHPCEPRKIRADSMRRRTSNPVVTGGGAPSA
jgi:hypothetical protein